MAALRNFTHALIIAKQNSLDCITKTYIVAANIKINKRFGSFQTSPVYDEKKVYTDFEITQDPVEWSYVTRLFKKKYIPAPPKNIEETASGWKPPKDEAKKLPYFVNRTKNHMIPVYLKLDQRNQRKRTVLRKIEGDIVRLEADLVQYIEKVTNKKMGTQISEPGGVIKIRGDFVNVTKRWLINCGF